MTSPSCSLSTNLDIKLKTEAQAVLEDVRAAIRAGMFDPRGQVVRHMLNWAADASLTRVNLLFHRRRGKRSPPTSRGGPDTR